MHSVTHLKNYIAKLQPTLGGRLLCFLLPSSKKIALQNMEIAFGDKLTEQEREKLMLCFASHIVKTVLEIIATRFLSTKAIEKRVEVLGVEHAMTVYEKGRGIILLSAHMGNWEFAPLGGVLQLKKLQDQIYIIRKKIPNVYLEKLLFGHFENAGIQVLAKEHSLRPVYRVLNNNGVIVLTQDQYAKPGARGILANFFGREVGTYKGLAKIAKKTGAAVVPVIPFRLASGKHVLQFLPEVKWIKHENPEQELRLNTEAYNRIIEDAIWAHPEQWQWRQRRWRV